jgi:hypothetical protein
MAERLAPHIREVKLILDYSFGYCGHTEDPYLRTALLFRFPAPLAHGHPIYLKTRIYLYVGAKAIRSSEKRRFLRIRTRFACPKYCLPVAIEEGGSRE